MEVTNSGRATGRRNSQEDINEFFAENFGDQIDPILGASNRVGDSVVVGNGGEGDGVEGEEDGDGEGLTEEGELVFGGDARNYFIVQQVRIAGQAAMRDGET